MYLICFKKFISENLFEKSYYKNFCFENHILKIIYKKFHKNCSEKIWKIDILDVTNAKNKMLILKIMEFVLMGIACRVVVVCLLVYFEGYL